MKGFIKITDVNDQEHYLNINYITRFCPLDEGHEGKTVFYLSGNEKLTRIQTNNTSEEIVDMIDLAN